LILDYPKKVLSSISQNYAIINFNNIYPHQNCSQ